MSRLIDAQTIKVSITRYGECVVKHKHLNFIKEMVKEIISDICFAIDAQPTVDAVPVVRCKECRKQCICYHSDTYFCADGEKVPK